MAEGIYMGGEALKGIASKQIRNLADAIKSQQKKFAKQAGKAKLWDIGGDILQSGLSMLGPLGVAAGAGADTLIDYFSSKALMGGKKAGDVDAIKKLQTAYTGGGYGEEFGKMLKESRPDFASGLLQNVGEGLKSYIAGETMGYLGKNWFPQGGGGMEGTPVADPSDMWRAREGGYVPKKYYGGGSVQGNSSPTIAGYFSQQGKTLGGSNQQSLAEMLGRR